MLPIVAGPDPKLATVICSCTWRRPVVVAVGVATISQVTVLPVSTPDLSSDLVVSFVWTRVPLELSRAMFANPWLALPTSSPTVRIRMS